MDEDVIENVQQTDLLAFFQTKILASPFDIILVGQISDPDIRLVNEVFGGPKLTNLAKPAEPLALIRPDTQKTHILTKEESLQSSIRMGQATFTKEHPDYFKWMITNEIFGGYFGSRLMKNIREDKGYTYGIYSNLMMFQHAGYWGVSTDVKQEYTQQTLEEIYKEAQRLREEPVEKKELETVRNYMLGSFVGSINTPFDLADIFKSIYFSGLDYAFYDRYVQTIKNIDPDEIRQTARQYLHPEDMHLVVVGGL